MRKPSVTWDFHNLLSAGSTSELSIIEADNRDLKAYLQMNDNYVLDLQSLQCIHAPPSS
jgi:hypothetical protein